MSVPSRAEVARAIAKKRFASTLVVGTMSATALVVAMLDAQALAGYPALIGTTHEGCETCDGTGTVLRKFDHRYEPGDPRFNPGEIPGRCRWCGAPEESLVSTRRHHKPEIVPCPDGRPVYWTAKDE